MDDGQQSQVDTTRPFSSVKEAVAVFGERLLLGDSHRRNATAQSAITSVWKPSTAAATPEPATTPTSAAPKPPAFPTSPSLSSRSFASFNSHGKSPQESEETAAVYASPPLSAVVKRLESELEDVRREMMLLMERESEMEVVVSSLNAEIRRSASRLAEMEAAIKVAGKARQELNPMEYEYLPSLSHLISLGEIENDFDSKKRTKKKKNRRPEMGMTMKEKPIVPLIGDVFSRKKNNNSAASTPRRHHSEYSPAFSGILS